MEQQLNQTEVEKTAENTQIDKKNRKKMVVAAMCLIVITILIFVLSFMKYLTPEMRGKVAYEPALFNTVLLGELTQEDVDRLTKDTSTNSEKLSTSLDLSKANEFGTTLASDNANSIKKVGPGTTTSLYFTVTNGTTLEENNSSSEGTETTTQNTNEKKKVNVAQSDIRYKLHVITTNNLPLSFTLTDLSTDTTVKLKKSDKTDDTLGNSDDYVVSEEDTSRIFNTDGERILKLQKGAITVHRYQLNVSWDATKLDENKNIVPDPDKTDIKYMKELENLEVRLEVESYVEHLNAVTSDTIAKGILTLDTANARDEYFTVNLGNLFAQKTVRYENFGSSALASNKIPDGVAVADNAKAYAYDFTVYNGTSVESNWVNGDGSKQGYYLRKYNGLVGGKYKVAVAVPTGEAGVGTNRSNTDQYAYYLKKGSDIYPLTAAKDADGKNKTTKTDVWEKTERENQKNVYDYKNTTEDAYQILIPSGNLQLSYSPGEFSSEDLTLYMVDKTGEGYKYQTKEEIEGKTKNNTKDDFRIYVYQ